MHFWHTIRGRLIIIVLAALLPALGVILWTSLEQRDEAIRNAEQQTLLLARNFAEQQQELTASTQQILRTLADIHNFHDHNYDLCLKTLRMVDERNDVYSHLLIVNPDGSIYISSKGIQDHNISDRKYFRDALAAKSFSVGEYVVNSETGHATIHFSYPLLDRNGDVRTIFAAALDLDAYWDFIKKVELPLGYRMNLLDSQGVRLLSFPDHFGSAKDVGAPISEESHQQVFSSRSEGIYEDAGSGSTVHIHAFRKLYLKGAAEPYMIITVGADKSIIVAKAGEIFRRNLFLLGLTFAVALVMSWFVGGASIVDRIRRLMEMSRQLRDGNFSIRTDIPHFKGELGVLAQSFDEMATALEAKTLERDQFLSRLKESDERYRLITNNATDVIWSCNAHLSTDYISPSVEKVLGWSPDELIGEKITKTISHSSLKFADRMYLSLVNNGSLLREPRQITMELEQTRKDGTTVWTEVVANPFLDNSGNLMGIAGVTRDITDRKQAERLLRDNEQKYRQLFEMESDALFLIEKDTGKILEVNAAAAVLYGYSRDELLGMRNVDLSAEPAKTARATQEEVQAIPVRYHRRKDGTVIPVEITASHFSWKGRQVHIAAIRDVRDRLKAQEALEKSEERYRGIFENTIIGIYQSTLEGRYLTVNPALAHMFGYDSTEEMIASVTDIGTQLYYDPEDRRRAMEILTASDRLERFEARCRRRDGAPIWTVINSRAVRDEKGSVLFIEGIIEDISERKLAEQERAKLEEKLRQAQKMEALGTLAGGIAHDFNNVLMAIIGFTELAGVESEEESRRECLDQVLTASRRAKDLVNQILTFSRMQEMERHPVQVNQIMKEVLKLLRSSIPTTIDIRSDIDRYPVVVFADPTQIHQVLMNLCTNAAHAMRERRGTLSVVLTQERFGNGSSPAPCGLPEGRYAKLQVSDTGYGMSKDVLDRVFDPFFTTKPQGEGTGLGLSVVYGIVHTCRGAIDINSRAGNGTTVSVYLPAAESAEASCRAVEVEASIGSEHVLFVDDEPALVDLGARALRSLGYRVTTRTSSLEALDFFRIRHRDIDVVVTDVTMPHLTGAELARKMIEIRRDIPIVLCTGYSEMVSEEKARKLGARGYIMKPANRADLARAVRVALDSEKGEQTHG